MTTHYRHRRTANPATAFPATIQPGEIAVNTATRRLVVGDAATATVGQPIDLLAIRVFSPNATYASGDLVTQAGSLYRARAAVTAGAFDATKWLKLDTTIPEFNAGSAYAKYDLVVRNNQVWRAPAAIAAGAWDPAKWWPAFTGVIGVPDQDITINMSLTGVAEPADPLAGNPFNSIDSIFLWARQYVFKCRRLVVNIAAGTYNSANPIIIREIGCPIVFQGAAPGAIPLKAPDINWADQSNPVAPARGTDELYADACAMRMSQQWLDSAGGIMAAIQADNAKNTELCFGTLTGDQYSGGRLKTIFRFTGGRATGFVIGGFVQPNLMVEVACGSGNGVSFINIGVKQEFNLQRHEGAVTIVDYAGAVLLDRVVVSSHAQGIQATRASNIICRSVLLIGCHACLYLTNSNLDVGRLTCYGSAPHNGITPLGVVFIHTRVTGTDFNIYAMTNVEITKGSLVSVTNMEVTYYKEFVVNLSELEIVDGAVFKAAQSAKGTSEGVKVTHSRLSIKGKIFGGIGGFLRADYSHCSITMTNTAAETWTNGNGYYVGVFYVTNNSTLVFPDAILTSFKFNGADIFCAYRGSTIVITGALDVAQFTGNCKGVRAAFGSKIVMPNAPGIVYNPAFDVIGNSQSVITSNA